MTSVLCEVLQSYLSFSIARLKKTALYLFSIVQNWLDDEMCSAHRNNIRLIGCFDRPIRTRLFQCPPKNKSNGAEYLGGEKTVGNNCLGNYETRQYLVLGEKQTHDKQRKAPPDGWGEPRCVVERCTWKEDGPRSMTVAHHWARRARCYHSRCNSNSADPPMNKAQNMSKLYL